MASGSESGAVFHVVNAKGVSVFSRAIGANLGSWESFRFTRWTSKVDGSGIFTMEVNGPTPATSPSFRIGEPEQLYSQGLANALSFYQNSATASTFNQDAFANSRGTSQRSACIGVQLSAIQCGRHIIGRLATGGGAIDASGGWWDAGDYLKFVKRIPIPCA